MRKTIQSRQFRNLYIILLTQMLLVSCDCFQFVTGTVIEQSTGKPMPNVTVQLKSARGETTTDSLGNFELMGVTGGFRCPPVIVLVEHPNYETIEIKKPTGSHMHIVLKTKSP